MPEKYTLKQSILDIFITDTKTTKYLTKRLESLNDEDFIAAAIKQRPSNRKLKDFLIGYEAYKAEPYKEELVEATVSDEEVSEPTSARNFRKELYEIFKNDKGTTKRLDKASENDTDFGTLLEVARKARPKNAKLRKLTAEYEFSTGKEVKKEIIPNLNVVSSEANREAAKNKKENKNNKNEKIVIEEEEEDDEDIIYIYDEPKYKDNVVKLSPVAMPDVKANLISIFENDIKTLEQIESRIDSDYSDEDLIEMAMSLRPKNVKLKRFLRILSDARACSEDDADSNIVFEDNDNYDAQDKKMMRVDTIPYVMNDSSNITMMLNGSMEVLNNEHPHFEDIVAALTEERWNDVFPLLDIRSKLIGFVYKQLEFKNDTLYHEGKELDGKLVEFIIKMVTAGAKDIQPFMRFLHKLLKNPSARAQQELYGFLASGKIPLNKRGNILTYKRINTNWTDCHSSTVSNKIGETVTMERAKVDDRQDVTCSRGLHVCSYSYLSSFGGGRTVICEVNPKDVVSIPTDYSNAKMRCCKYTILKEIKNNGIDVLSENPIYWD